MNRLRFLRNEKGESLEKIAKYLNVTIQTISNYENEKRDMTPDTILKIAEYFNVSTDYLLGKSNIKEEKKDELGNPVITIPVLGTVKAGYDYLAQENWIDTVDIDKKLADTGEFFALKIHGDSMSPVFIEDDTVIIRKQDDFENGDIVVAIVNGEEATVKKGKKSDNSILLQPLNTNYEPLIFSKEQMKTIPVQIVGIVKKMYRKF